jgi:ATP-binding cassette subfamily G (WHITE) protein 2 (SNQ2)
MKAFFRGLAAAFKAEAPAQAVAGILVLALALYTVGRSTYGLVI